MKTYFPLVLMLATAPAFAQNAEPAEAELELVSFVAESAGPDGVRLHWTTVSERPNEFFLVQRSQNGLTWETATGTAGTGRTETTTYTVMDTHPFTDISYYRLLSLEGGVPTELSDVFAVAHQPMPQLNIYSQAEPGRFLVTSEGTITDLKLLNDRGQFIPLQLDIQSDEIRVNAELLTPGHYYVQALVNGSPVLRPVTFTGTSVIGG